MVMTMFYKCNYCNFDFGDQSDLKHHLKNVHECIICGYILNSNIKDKNLKKHYLSKHNVDIGGFCDYCQYATENSEELNQHIMEEHRFYTYETMKEVVEKEKSENGYKLNTVNELTAHVRSNHNKRKYNCLKCSYKASTAEEFSAHVRSDHFYECKVCQFKTFSKEDYESHTKNHPRVNSHKVVVLEHLPKTS